MDLGRKIVDEIRPRDWDEFVGQEKNVTYFNRWIKRKSCPDIICMGPPGTGKTTSVKIFISKMFNGYNIWDNEHPDVKWLNASDERGIDVVRQQIKDFAATEASVNVEEKVIPFRFVVLEEGDQVTSDAQNAMRATVEDFSDTCRFIWIGNTDKYIDALKSRSAILYFSALPEQFCAEYFHGIAADYGVEINEQLSEIIAAYYEGDLRKMLNDCLEKLVGIDHPVEMSDLDFDTSSKSIGKNILEILYNPEFDARKAYFEARKEFTSKHAKLKFNLRRFLKSFHELMGPMVFDVAEAFAKCDENLREGNVKDIQIGALFKRIAICQRDK